MNAFEQADRNMDADLVEHLIQWTIRDSLPLANSRSLNQLW